MFKIQIQRGRLLPHVLPLSSPLRLFEPRAWGLWTGVRPKNKWHRPNSKMTQLSNPCNSNKRFGGKRKKKASHPEGVALARGSNRSYIEPPP
ncbi:hypothetical protein QL285_096357 [Trifolium repens]|nr:hypothetical protein QL285_096357 [Trifolium repens]